MWATVENLYPVFSRDQWVKERDSGSSHVIFNETITSVGSPAHFHSPLPPVAMFKGMNEYNGAFLSVMLKI